MIEYKSILDNLYEGVYYVDKDRKILFWNKAAEKITGYTRKEVEGHHCFEDILRHIDDDGTLLCKGGCPLEHTIQSGYNREAQVYLHHKEGHRVPVLVKTSPVRNNKGEVLGAVELFTDSTPERAIQQRIKELESLAMLDPLTELANRRYTENAIEQRLVEKDRYGWSCGVVYLDIDCFKKVNDIYGHSIGDEVLITVAKTLVGNSRPFDLFGRIGGEEFVGVMRNMEDDDLVRIANKLCMLVKGAGIEADGHLIRVTVSVGATLLQKGDTVKSVLKRADELMYTSKKTGKNKVTSDLPARN